MREKRHISGFVLAGGKSTRMGRDKAWIVVKGRPMIVHAISALEPICNTVAIVAQGEMYNSLGVPIYQDVVVGAGPLAGICTALAVSDTEVNVFTCCDSPFVVPDLLRLLLEQSEGFDAVVPRMKDAVYPLTAVYKRTCLPAFEACLMAGQLSVKKTIHSVHVKYVDVLDEDPFLEARVLMNINTPRELEKIDAI
ncbi:MAG: molybdenum cofactor guanylyltransferase [Flavobacteriales bacterium]|nr:molybdenum cofactor guanylyltransferase [Flavobacteriales bacterium]MCB9447296.1 molybdenum cofactor guanylyltransferase [Flavobacteriales bacterium]